MARWMEMKGFRSGRETFVTLAGWSWKPAKIERYNVQAIFFAVKMDNVAETESTGRGYSLMLDLRYGCSDFVVRVGRMSK